MRDGSAGVPRRVINILRCEGLQAMAVRVYLGSAPSAQREIVYEEADAFRVTAGGFLLVQRQHSGAQRDLAVFAPTAWRHCASPGAARLMR